MYAHRHLTQHGCYNALVYNLRKTPKQWFVCSPKWEQHEQQQLFLITERGRKSEREVERISREKVGLKYNAHQKVRKLRKKNGSGVDDDDGKENKHYCWGQAKRIAEKMEWIKKSTSVFCFGVIIETCPEIDSYHQMDGNYILKMSREQDWKKQ